jgi:hypothetical protein
VGLDRHVHALTLTLAVAGAFACRNQREEVDGWALARNALTDGKECFAERAEYCLNDPALVDSAIRPRLDALYGGEMPKKKVYVDAVVREAVREYRRRCAEPANLRRIETLVAERYENPKAERRGDEFWIDFGVVPGKLSASRASFQIELRETPLAQKGRWTDAEARDKFVAALTKYPDEKQFVLVVTVPDGHAFATFTFRFERDRKGVIVGLGPRHFIDRDASANDNFANFSLSPEALDSCSSPSSCPR